MVNNQETTSCRLLGICGLDWKKWLMPFGGQASGKIVFSPTFEEVVRLAYLSPGGRSIRLDPPLNEHAHLRRVFGCE